jgi:hypothetical protein
MRKPIIQALVIAVAGVGCGAPAADGTAPTAPGAQQPGVGGLAGAPAPVQPNGTTPPANTTPNTTGMTPVGPGVTPPVGTPGVTPPVGTPGTTPPVGTDMPANMGGTGEPATDLPAATGGPISEACRGFDFTNILYSPGGEVLPNKCEAYHGTLNNPYAVRCVDVWPWYKTKFPGDVYCVLPPPPDKGVQFGHHPQGEGNAWHDIVSKGDMSGYENPPADWTLDPGGEEERNIVIKHTNTAGKYYRMNNRMRGGSHHMIVSAIANPTGTNVWGPGGADGLFNGAGIPGAQRPDENTPQSRTIPEEDVGLYRSVDANIGVQYNMHHFNSTNGPILKEAWQNIWWTDDARTAVDGINGLPILQAVGTFANPGEIVDMHYSIAAPGPVRVLGLFGHRHAWTTNFSAWVERGGGEPEIVYQSFDWFDEPTFQYNSQVMNPVANSPARTDAAFTGILNLNPGDQLHFNCHIEYTDARAAAEMSPVTPAANGPLRFSNQAFNAEMCILFGASVGQLGAPEQLGAPPSFASQY